MRFQVAIALFMLTGCMSSPAPTPAPEAITDPVKLSPGTAWVAAGEGWAEEARAVFAEATSYAETIAASRPAETWAVVLDLDETVLNNVEYQIARETLGEGFTPESWYAWTQEERATLVPGADVFIEFVNAAGGHVAFVTNRSDTEQLATEKNLASVGLQRGDDFQVMLTRARPKGVSEKDGRFEIVPALLAVQGYDGVEIVAYVGDNIGDKPKTPGDWQFFCIDQGAMYGAPCAEVPGPGR
jgi:5'-nucleotidase (lipoprotein e(P4) family)